MAGRRSAPLARETTSFRLAAGFRAGGTSCGLKPSGAFDLALVAASGPCTAAGVFTRNRVQAAPILHDRDVLDRNPGEVRAVIANSGCANACTGERGLADTRRMAEWTAEALGCRADQVLVLSTGVIGVFLDMEKIRHGIERLAAPDARLEASDAAQAILTTDTRAKVAAAEVAIDGRTVAIRGLAKGAGMIHPDMATLLAIVTTDARIVPTALDAALREAVRTSFNRISVDGDTSTNDTVLLLASGVSGIQATGPDESRFTAGLTEVCISLAKQIARDGEGATRLVEITATCAANEEQAHRVVDAIARSLLVKTAIHGGDPNWGRILSAAGASGESVDPERMSLFFGPAGSEIQLTARGARARYEERAAAAELRRDPVRIRLDLGLGEAAATVWTCDLSAEYVAINAAYTT